MTATRRRSRTLTAVLVGAVLALTGCGGDEPAGSGEAAGNEFSAAGISFEAPEGWEQLDPGDTGLAEEDSAEIAEGLGMTAEQLQATVQQVDLFVVDGEGPQGGFLSNINVLEQDGELPEDAVIEEQFSGLGASVVDVTQEDTDAGEVTAVTYDLEASGTTVRGASYLLARGEQVVTITVSTPDRDSTTSIGEEILGSLAEAG